MKKETKKRLKENLLDAILEVVFGVICIAIGAGVLMLFGKSIDDMDFEVMALIGIGVIVAIAILVYLAFRMIKKKKSSEENDGISQLNKDENSK
ncbi:MAG: hypothetical protein J6A54_00545 [Clostridia bacterium]|nr:hypothetical protein [Clostridia bacterium]